MPRQRVHKSNAAKQKAYRKRLAKWRKDMKDARELIAILDANKDKPDYAGFLRRLRQLT